MNKKKIIAQLCIFLIVMLPISFADEFEEQGESLIIEAKKYEPDTLRSDFMEQLNIPVFVTLGAIRGEPISVPEIKNVKLELIKQKQAQRENATVKGTPEQTIEDYIQGTPKFYKAPVPTLDNLGYLKITLKKIPQEHKVPKQIDLDFKATITYEAEIAGFTIGGESVKELKQEAEEQAKENKHDRAILGERAYLRVSSIRGRDVTIYIYDQNFERLTSVTVEEGKISRSITIPGIEGVQPESIRLKVEEVRNTGKIKLRFKDEKKLKTFDRGEEILDEWKISYASYKDGYIRFRHPDFKTTIVLTKEDKYNNIKSLREEVEDKCDYKKECKIYAESNIEILKNQEYPKEDFLNALESLESIGLEKFEGIEENIKDRYAIFQTLSGEEHYYEGYKIGECSKCKVSSIFSDSVYITGVRDCDPNIDRSNTIKLEVGQDAEVCKDALSLKGISTQEEAVITVLPGTGRGETTTYFSIHIPVEERAIQYTPEELQDKIERTKELIAKLDKTINNLQNLVEGWTKVCLATAAVFTVMSFFKGMSALKKPEKEPGVEGKKEEDKESRYITMNPPEGVSSITNLEFWNPSENKYQKLSPSGEPYYFHTEELRMYPQSKYNPIAHAGAKFRYQKPDRKYDYYILNEKGEFTKVEKGYGDYGGGDNSGKYEMRFSPSGNEMSVGIQDCNQLPGEYYRKCKVTQNQYGSALTLVYDEQKELMEVWHNGEDGKFYRHKNGKLDGDKEAFEIPQGTTEFNTLKKRLVGMQDQYRRGEKTYRWGSSRYNLGKGLKGSRSEDIECEEVMGPGQCKILFNACDPVMCPPSRCDFNDRYRVDDVIQSGLLGSLLLCLPNIKEGVLMPVCLSGILAALKNIRSILQGYVNCLQTALQDDESVGICDRIRSIYICQILWREAMTLLGLARGNLFDAVVGKGGGEYLTGIQGGVESAKETVDYFTKSYATSVFAAYRGRSSREIGAEICEKAIYGKGPIIGDIIEDITEAQNPPQFTAYIEEQPYSEIAQQSAYKLYYHIYSGSQTVNYKVYLRKEGKTYSCQECSGTIQPEEFVDKSTTFLQEPEYQEICIIINGKQSCGFGRLVSSSFGLTAANDYITQYELSKRISTETQCRADTTGYLPRAQVEKVCSIINPGTGKGKNEEEIWRKVGTCGKNEAGAFQGDCWMKLGNLEEKNPELYRSVIGGLCEENNGKVCDINEKCKGREEITSVSGGYKNVECCYGTCETDESRTELKKEILGESFIKEEDAYAQMYELSKEKCEDEDIGTNDPFHPDISKPSAWLKKRNEMKDARVESKEYQQFLYFKGLMYLICKNCGDARTEFNKIENKDYYKKACGNNTKEDGGLMLNYCPNPCKGKIEEEAKKAEPEFKPLQLRKLTLVRHDDKKIDIDGDAGKIELETGGTYIVEKMEFDKPVKSCSFYFGIDKTKLTTVKSGTSVCTITEDNKFSTSGIKDESKLYMYILGENRDYPEDVYAKIFDIKLLEKSVKSGTTFICKTQDNNYFCIDETGTRCSDYHYGSNEKIKAEFYKESGAALLSGCKVECNKGNPEACTLKATGYGK